MAISDNRSATSDREYLRLFTYGESTIDCTTAIAVSDPDSLIYSFRGDFTVTHNQGEVVLARAWMDFAKNGRLCNIQARSPGFARIYARSLTNSTIIRIVSTTSVAAIPIYYKVYKPA